MKEEQIIALVRLIVPIIFSVLVGFGIEIDANIIAVCLFTICALCTYVWAWWKNNNMTEAARTAQRFLNEIKENK